MTQAKRTRAPQATQPHPTDPADRAAHGNDEVSKRIAAKRKERASRQNTDVFGANYKLSVPEEMKDPRFVYRHVLDVGTRVHDLKARDWEIAPAEGLEHDPRNIGVGTSVERMGNVRTVTKPEKHILMRKPKEFYKEDEGRKQAKIKKDEQAMRAGNVQDPQGLSGPGSYIPAGGMKIEHGR